MSNYRIIFIMINGCYCKCTNEVFWLNNLWHITIWSPWSFFTFIAIHAIHINYVRFLFIVIITNFCHAIILNKVQLLYFLKPQLPGSLHSIHLLYNSFSCHKWLSSNNRSKVNLWKWERCKLLKILGRLLYFSLDTVIYVSEVLLMTSHLEGREKKYK